MGRIPIVRINRADSSMQSIAKYDMGHTYRWTLIVHSHRVSRDVGCPIQAVPPAQ